MLDKTPGSKAIISPGPDGGAACRLGGEPCTGGGGGVGIHRWRRQRGGDGGAVAWCRGRWGWGRGGIPVVLPPPRRAWCALASSSALVCTRCPGGCTLLTGGAKGRLPSTHGAVEHRHASGRSGGGLAAFAEL